LKYAAQGVISERKMLVADMAYSFTRSQKNNPALVEVALAQRDERVPMLDNADLGGADLRKTDLSGFARGESLRSQPEQPTGKSQRFCRP